MKAIEQELNNLNTFTRLTVVDSTGRAYEKWDVRLQFLVSDEERTLKIFVEEAREE